jgi:hypothetical protein
MSRLRLFRIVACFAMTFVLGGVAGWLLKPAARPSPEGARPLPPGQAVMENLDPHLHFTAAQKEVLKPILNEWGAKVEQVRNRPRWRRELFEEYAPRIRLALVPAQTVEYDRLVGEARARFDRRLR